MKRNTKIARIVVIAFIVTASFYFNVNCNNTNNINIEITNNHILIL